MLKAKKIICFFLFSEACFSAYASESWPEKLVKEMECLKQQGLIQGSLVDVQYGDAHFAPQRKPLAIGGEGTSIRFNGAFIEGKTNLSPDIIKKCIPNLILKKSEQ